MNPQFFFKLAGDLVQIAEQDMRINILTVDDGECENLKLIGIDKDSENPCIKVEDEDGDPFYIFTRHIISITPTEAFEEEEDEDDEAPEDEGPAEEDA